MTSLFGTVSPALQPPGRGKESISCRQNERREEDRMMEGGARRQKGRNESWREEANQRFKEERKEAVKEEMGGRGWKGMMEKG